MQRSQWQQWPIIAGILLVAGGILLLFNNLGWADFLGPILSILWAGLFLVGAFLFLTAYLRNRAQWWMLIPAGALAALGATILFSLIGFLDQFAGAVFLGGMGATFLLVYMLHQENWWALIPAGVLLLLAMVVILGELPFIPSRWSGALQGSIFLGGLGLGFLGVYLFRREHWWALIPGGVLLVLGTLPIVSEVHWASDWIPLIFFGGIGGVFLLLYGATQMRWSMWVGLGCVGFALFVQLVSGPSWLSGSLFAVALIIGGTFTLLRARTRPS